MPIGAPGGRCWLFCTASMLMHGWHWLAHDGWASQFSYGGCWVGRPGVKKKKGRHFSPTEGPRGNDRSAGGTVCRCRPVLPEAWRSQITECDGHPSSISKNFLIQALPGFGPGTRLRLHEPSRAFDTPDDYDPLARAVQGGWRLAATECVARPGQRFVRRAGAGADLRHRPVGLEPPPQGAGPGRAGGDAPRGQRDLLPAFAAPGRTHRQAPCTRRCWEVDERALPDDVRARIDAVHASARRSARTSSPARGGQVPGPTGPDRRTAAIPRESVLALLDALAFAPGHGAGGRPGGRRVPAGTRQAFPPGHGAGQQRGDAVGTGAPALQGRKDWATSAWNWPMPCRTPPNRPIAWC